MGALNGSAFAQDPSRMVLDKPLLPLFLLVLSLLTAASFALDMEYISPEQKEQLVRKFEQATLDKTEGVLDKKWSCDMYGVRSRLQVQRNLKLYSFAKAPSGLFKNSGAQVVADYKNDGQSLLGHSQRFEDQVRLTPSGQLISRLSLRQPDAIVIAYAVCKSL